jgi:hypothetical protein
MKRAKRQTADNPFTAVVTSPFVHIMQNTTTRNDTTGHARPEPEPKSEPRPEPEHTAHAEPTSKAEPGLGWYIPKSR